MSLRQGDFYFFYKSVFLGIFRFFKFSKLEFSGFRDKLEFIYYGIYNFTVKF